MLDFGLKVAGTLFASSLVAYVVYFVGSGATEALASALGG